MAIRCTDGLTWWLCNRSKTSIGYRFVIITFLFSLQSKAFDSNRPNIFGKKRVACLNLCEKAYLCYGFDGEWELGDRNVVGFLILLKMGKVMLGWCDK